MLKDKERRRKMSIAYDTQGRNERLQALAGWKDWYTLYQEYLPESVRLYAITKTPEPEYPECPENYSYGEFHASAIYREYNKNMEDHRARVNDAKDRMVAIQRVVFGDSRKPETTETIEDLY